MEKLLRAIFAATLTFAVSACATEGGGSIADGPRWTAHGYLTPGPTSDPEIIGTFDTESACKDAVDAWMSRQVVGNPIFGECLPVDRR